MNDEYEHGWRHVDSFADPPRVDEPTTDWGVLQVAAHLIDGFRGRIPPIVKDSHGRLCTQRTFRWVLFARYPDILHASNVPSDRATGAPFWAAWKRLERYTIGDPCTWEARPPAEVAVGLRYAIGVTRGRLTFRLEDPL